MLKAQVECVNVEDKRRESATEILCFTQTRVHAHAHTHRYASDQNGNYF